jgi:hypothetical protein
MECNVSKKNLGTSKCTKLPALLRGMITTPDDFYFTPTNMLTSASFKTALQDAIVDGINSRVYLWPFFVGFENASEEAVYEDTPLSVNVVRDGQYRFKFHIRENICIHKAMYTHRSNEGRVIFIDVEGNFWGTEDADGNFMGFSVQLINTEKMIISDGSVSTKTPIYVCLLDNKEADKNGALADGSFINTIKRLTDVEIESVSQAAASIVVDVKIACDGTPISGLLVADFLLYATDGVTAQTISSATENANIPGRYTLAAPGGNDFEDGTLTLRAASALTVKAYEVPTALTINV